MNEEMESFLKFTQEVGQSSVDACSNGTELLMKSRKPTNLDDINGGQERDFPDDEGKKLNESTDAI